MEVMKPSNARTATPGTWASMNARDTSPPFLTAQRRCVADCASCTNSLVPERLCEPFLRSERYTDGLWSPAVVGFGNCEANGIVSSSDLRKIARSFCSAVPASAIVRAARTPDEKKGPVTGPRPSSSKTTAASVKELPEPPYSTGMSMPSQPMSRARAQSSGVVSRWASSSSMRVSLGNSRCTKSRETRRRSSCSSVRDRSMWNPGAQGPARQARAPAFSLTDLPMPIRRDIMTRWMSAVPAGCRLAMEFRWSSSMAVFRTVQRLSLTRA